MADAKTTELFIFVAFIFNCHDGIIPSRWNTVLSLVRVFWALCCNVEMETVDWRGESPAWSQLSVILHPITILYLTSNYPSPQRTRFQDSLNTVSNYHQLSDSEAALYGNIFQFRLKSSSGKHWTVRKKVDSIVGSKVFMHLKNILGDLVLVCVC